MRTKPGPGAYVAWWIASYAVPFAAAWPLWYVSHDLSVAVLVTLTLVILGCRPAGKGKTR